MFDLKRVQEIAFRRSKLHFTNKAPQRCQFFKYKNRVPTPKRRNEKATVLQSCKNETLFRFAKKSRTVKAANFQKLQLLTPRRFLSQQQLAAPRTSQNSKKNNFFQKSTF